MDILETKVISCDYDYQDDKFINLSDSEDRELTMSDQEFEHYVKGLLGKNSRLEIGDCFLYYILVLYNPNDGNDHYQWEKVSNELMCKLIKDFRELRS